MVISTRDRSLGVWTPFMVYGVLERHDSDKLPVHNLPSWLFSNNLVVVLQHQHLRLFAAVSRLYGLLHHDAVLLLLGMVLYVLGLLRLLVHPYPRLLLLLLWMGMRGRRNLLLHMMNRLLLLAVHHHRLLLPLLLISSK